MSLGEMDENDAFQTGPPTSNLYSSINDWCWRVLARFPRPSRHAMWLIYSLLLLVNLTNGISNLPLNRLLERRLCRKYYDSDRDVDEGLCKVDSVQQDLAWIMGAFETLWIAGDFVTTIPLTFLAERYGRKKILLLNAGPRLFMLFWILSIAHFEDSLPPRAAIAGASLSVLGGDTVFNSLIYGLAAQAAEDRVTRAIYFSRMTALTSVIGFLSPAIAAAAMTIQPSLPFWLGSVFMVLALMITMLLPTDDDIPDDATEARRPLISSPTLKAQASRTSLTASMIDRVYSLVAAVANRRLALLLLSMFLTSLASADTKLLAQYISKRYHWSFSSAGYLLSAKAIVNFILLTFVVPFFLSTQGASQSLSDGANVRYAKFCLVSSVVGAFAIGVSSVIWELIPSLAIYALGVPLSVFTLSLANSDNMWTDAEGGGADGSNTHNRVLSIVMMVKTLGSLVGAPLMALFWYYGIHVSFYGSPYILSSLVYLCAWCVLRNIRLQ
ncbi:major facilitator superfamily domain-containing protein [Astrocystis sublimbata]|nr:major facilitator superfamily domain-containing protein [Astrocystis sublimbata]